LLSAKINGLAINQKGNGEPVLLMPYPHASAYHPMIESPLVSILNELGFSVLTFDPPGIYSSDRLANVTLDEMLTCANEVLDYFKVEENVMVVGHSQSGFCSIAFAIEFPWRVRKLVLIGSVSGWPAVKKTGIHKQFRWFTTERWKLMYFGTRKMLGMSNLLIHKKLDQLVKNNSFVDKRHVTIIPLNSSDRKASEPIRAKWMVNLRKYHYDYSRRLHEISVPTLLCVGGFDLQTPVNASKELNKGISGSVLRIFNRSGHAPFIEEQEEFVSTLKRWLNGNA
jgi:pimeloyl-ACP methyl ester carboxylesterase